MRNSLKISRSHTCSGGCRTKELILLLLLVVTCRPVQAQFVDIAIDLQSRIEVKSIGLQTISQNPELKQAGRTPARQNNFPVLNWTRIRTMENLVLMVEINYLDPMEGKNDKSAAYLNNGSDQLMESRSMKGQRVSFPLKSSAWQESGINSPPRSFDAWIGVPDGLVRELIIGYN